MFNFLHTIIYYTSEKIISPSENTQGQSKSSVIRWHSVAPTGSISIDLSTSTPYGCTYEFQVSSLTHLSFLAMFIAIILGHYKLDHSFPSTARMPFELPPTFSIIALIFYQNENIDDVIENFNIIYGLFHVRSSCKPRL